MAACANMEVEDLYIYIITCGIMFLLAVVVSGGSGGGSSSGSSMK